MTSDREDRIKQLARRIWESEGRPAGQEVRHWYMAVKLVEASERPDPYVPDAHPDAARATAQGAVPPAGPAQTKPAKKTGTTKNGVRKKPGKPGPG
jgi:hypothetical protein